VASVDGVSRDVSEGKEQPLPSILRVPRDLAKAFNSARWR